MLIRNDDTSREISYDCKLMRSVSSIFRRKMISLSVNVPQHFDVQVVEGSLLYDADIFLFKLMYLFLHWECLND